MPGLSTGIQIALNAVLTHSQAIEIIEHNVANANTPGYRRQAAVVSSALAYPAYGIGLDHTIGAGQQGSGILMERIQRFTSDYLDARYRSAGSEASDWSTRQDMLLRLEAVMAETSEAGLIPSLDQFWSAWQRLAADPTNLSLRTNLLSDANSLVTAIRSRRTEMTQMRVDSNQLLKNQVDEINNLASQIARINGEISHVQAVNEQPNDMLDQRDRLLDRLSEIAGAVSFVQPNGEVVVNINGHVLVAGRGTVQLNAEVDPMSPDRLYQVTWADGQKMSPAAGEMKGLLTARDQTIVSQINGLDQFAAALIAQVNTLHSDANGRDLNGNVGGAFFSGSNAGDIAVNASLTEEAIVAGGADAGGTLYDNFIADRIANLKTTRVPIGGSSNQTLNEFYNFEITRLATDTAKSVEYSKHKSLLYVSLNEQRESLVGVSLDEEAANLAKYQKAYQAAARVMNAYDELLDRVINGMGLVGR